LVLEEIAEEDDEYEEEKKAEKSNETENHEGIHLDIRPIVQEKSQQSKFNIVIEDLESNKLQPQEL